jgi:tetratricopeptide (TPR) repeat protein
MGDLPRAIGPYTLGARLGAGGMGEVCQAYDQRLGRHVAIKLIPAENAGDESLRERFCREARAAARLSHPAIVQIFDVLPWNGGEAIVMELVEGRNLAALLETGPLDLQTGLRLGREIAEGLAAAHAKGILHRDLKPDNVLVGAEGHAKILDFGLAKSLEEGQETALTRERTVVGTYRSMSPEQARGLPLDARSDLFSLGGLLYEMLTGRAPFGGVTAMDTLANICSAGQTPARELAPGVPATVSDLIDQLLEKDPPRRPASAREVAARLEAVSARMLSRPDDEKTWIDAPPIAPDAAGPPVALSGSRGYSTAHSGMRWALLATLVLLLAGGGLVWWKERSSEPAHRAPVAAAAPLLYTAVTKPETGSAAGEQVQLLASGLRLALVRGLLALDGARPVPLEQVDAFPGPPVRAARTLAADEVLTSRLECPGDLCQVTLSRIDGRDGRLLWSQGFAVPLDRPYVLQEAVQGYLGQAYPGRRVQPEIARLDVRPEDYSEYLRLRHAFEARSGKERLDPETLFARLETIRRTSPRFLDAYVFESEVRQQRYKSSQEPRDLERAGQLLAEARELAPLDPRPSTGGFGLAMIRGDLDGAEAALRELERLQPGEPTVLIDRARLLEKRGRIEEALALMREGTRRRPSVKNLARAAGMAYRQGRFTEARDDLRQLFRRDAGYYDGLTLLGQVELLHGDTHRAVEIYQALVERYPRPVELTNLGFAQLYLGDYAGAEKSFRRFVALEPENPINLLNLADSLHLQGRIEEAAATYRRTVAAVPATSEDEQDLSARAQALAHLGRGPDAVEAVQKILRTAPDGPQTAYELSLVYTLLGDRTTARFNGLRALQQGVAPKLFDLPWFAPLRADPAFAAEVKRRAMPRPG